MAKYCFKVRLKYNETKFIVFPSMDELELNNFDAFVLESKSYSNLCSKLEKEFHIKPNEIIDITIFNQRTGSNYSLIFENKYLDYIVSEVKTKKIQGYGNYFMDAKVVPINQNYCLEMKDYLLNNLKDDYQFFLKNIYNYQNKFQELLYRYGAIYKQGIYNEEDETNLRELEQRISLELSIYKNYRGLCKARKKWEDYGNMYLTSKNNLTGSIKNLKPTINIKQVSYTFDKKQDLEDRTIIFNQEYDEFLEPEEYEEMVDEGYKRG